jgi:hypothetical protein
VKSGTRIAAAVLSIGIVATAAPISTAGIVEEKVVGGAMDQTRPTSDGTSLAYTGSSRRTGSDVYVRALGASSDRRVNEAGTAAWLGSFVGTTDEIVYQQATSRRSAIMSYDVSDRTRAPLGGEIASSDWEWYPVASDEVVLFLRDVVNGQGRYVKTQLLLADRSSGQVTTLIGDTGRAAVYPGYAGDRYVAWTRCRRTCTIAVYDLDTQLVTPVPPPSGKVHYSPAIDESTDTIYYVRTGFRCGRAVTIQRAPLTDPLGSERIHQLPVGDDIQTRLAFSIDAGTMERELFFTRFDCRQVNADIYVLHGVDPASLRMPMRAAGAGRAPRGQAFDRLAPGASGSAR